MDLKNKRIFVIELFCSVEPNISRKDKKKKKDKNQDLVSELRKLHTGITVKLVLIFGMLGYKASCKRKVEIIIGHKASVKSLLCSFRKAVLLSSLRIVKSLELCWPQYVNLQALRCNCVYFGFTGLSYNVPIVWSFKSV